MFPISAFRTVILGFALLFALVVLGLVARFLAAQIFVALTEGLIFNYTILCVMTSLASVIILGILCSLRLRAVRICKISTELPLLVVLSLLWMATTALGSVVDLGTLECPVPPPGAFFLLLCDNACDRN